MSMTITEKILAQHAGLVNVVPGQLKTLLLELTGGLIPYVERRKNNA